MPCLETLFNKKSETTVQKRNVKIVESVEKYSYSQKKVADYLGLHYSAISRLLKKINPDSENKDLTPFVSLNKDDFIFSKRLSQVIVYFSLT